jgi:2'-5' RNA ligase
MSCQLIRLPVPTASALRGRMKPGDRLVCAFVEKFDPGYEFKEWPLHVTIVPWFRIEATSRELTRQFEQVITPMASFEIVIDGTARFGRNKLVNLVLEPSPLTEVEKRVRGVLKERQAWLVDETTKRHHAFRPHVTTQKSARLNESDHFRCDRLYIVEQKGDHKLINTLVMLD